MPVITRISTQKKKGRYNIEIDHRFAFGVSETLLARENLHKGLELSLGRMQELEQAVFEDKLYEKALNFLSYRPRSRREVELYLRRKVNKSTSANSMPNLEGALERILSRLEQQSYIDDPAFAKWWVEQRTLGKNPKGPRLVRMELYQKGVAQEVIDGALSGVTGVSLVKKAALKQAPRYKDLESQAFKRRLSGYLLRRGFLWEDIKPVVDELSR